MADIATIAKQQPRFEASLILTAQELRARL